MILKRALFPLLAGCAGLSAMLAQADVLEVGEAGQARWVAGPMVIPAQISGTPLAEVPASAGRIADHAVVHSARNANNVPARYAPLVAQLSARYDLSPALIEAVVWQESRWRENAVSPKGARGLAQLMPGTARELGVDPDDPAANLEGGARYLREQLNRFDGDLELALAAYNAGPGRVERARGIPKIRETQAYVASVMGRLSNHSRSSE